MPTLVSEAVIGCWGNRDRKGQREPRTCIDSKRRFERLLPFRFGSHGRANANWANPYQIGLTGGYKQAL
jgi:hypothetical protein